MIDLVHRFVVPQAYAILPSPMASDAATAMLLAIGLQESGFIARQQANGGPARGFWQFEVGGIGGVVRHEKTRVYVGLALLDLCYGNLTDRIPNCHDIVQHNDVLACIFARLLLWTLPGDLPERGDADLGWSQYLAAWRPGRPRREAWNAHFAHAWELVSET